MGVFRDPSIVLTDTQVKSAKASLKPYKISDDGGLYLFVSKTGAKSWRYKYRLGGKEQLFSIGPYPDVSLKTARAEHARARELVAQGTHPKHHRDLLNLKKATDSESTFEFVAKSWIENHRADWTAYYLGQVETVFKNDVYPSIGTLPIKQVTAAHLLQILKRVEKRGAETVAGLIRMWCSAIFRHAIAHLQAEADPAAALKGAVKRPKVQHHKRLTAKQLPDFSKKLASFQGNRATAIALELLLLTFVRTVEMRKAEWGEFDLDAATWHLPAARMKMRVPHIVPLPPRAVELLRELHKLTGSGTYLFPNRRRPKECMNNTTVNAALGRMGYAGKLSGHGFRGTASTLLHEQGYRTEIIERQLAHAEGNKVKAAYNAAEYLGDRRVMLERWAVFVRTGISNVVPIKHVA